jgi:hypothetical protein
VEFVAAASSPFELPFRDTQVAWPAIAVDKLWRMGWLEGDEVLESLPGDFVSRRTVRA